MQTTSERYTESLHQQQQLLRELDRIDELADAAHSQGVEAQQRLNLELSRIRQQLRADLSALAKQLGVA